MQLKASATTYIVLVGDERDTRVLRHGWNRPFPLGVARTHLDEPLDLPLGALACVGFEVVKCTSLVQRALHPTIALTGTDGFDQCIFDAGCVGAGSGGAHAGSRRRVRPHFLNLTRNMYEPPPELALD